MALILTQAKLRLPEKGRSYTMCLNDVNFITMSRVRHYRFRMVSSICANVRQYLSTSETLTPEDSVCKRWLE
jgi:hypothetical protein